MTTTAQDNAAHSVAAEEVYYIEGKCGVTLDVIFGRAKAIKTYILEHKIHTEDARLCMVRGGRKYYFIPSGSAVDYA